MANGVNETYFSLLNDDLLLEISKFAVSKMNQTAEETEKLVYLLFAEKSPFTSICGDIFREVTVKHSGGQSCLGCHIMIDYGLDSKLNRKVMQKCGRKITHLNLEDIGDVDDRCKSYVDEIIAFMDMFNQEGLYLEELWGVSINGDLTSNAAKHIFATLAMTVSAHLWVMDLNNTSDKLSISYGLLPRNCYCLKEFWYSGVGLQSLTPFWPYIGKTLQEVRLDSPDTEWMQTIANLQSYCRQLTNIELIDPFSDPLLSEATFEQFLVSYGDQLEHVDLTDIDPEICRVVAQACSNVRCTISEMDNEFCRIAELGSKLYRLKLFIDREDDDNGHLQNWNELREAMSKAVQLEILDIDLEIGASVLQHIFIEGSLQKLEHLDLRIPNAVLGRSCLDCINNTGRLLCLDVRALKFENGTLFKVVLSSNPRIQYVYLEELDQIGREAHLIVPFVYSFISPVESCNELKTFSLRTCTNQADKLTALENDLQTCVLPLQQRRINARIFLTARGLE